MGGKEEILCKQEADRHLFSRQIYRQNLPEKGLYRLFIPFLIHQETPAVPRTGYGKQRQRGHAGGGNFPTHLAGDKVVRLPVFRQTLFFSIYLHICENSG